jgi:hypothetical protein
MIIMVEVKPETNQFLLALAQQTRTPFHQAAGAILDNKAAWVLEVQRMRPQLDMFGGGDGFPQGGDA